jgi:glycosyltransferase involved in cell wall biosynthesis
MSVANSSHPNSAEFDSSMTGRALHIVQVGFDDTVFQTAAPSDTLNRQLEYGRELDRQRPGSQLSLVIITPNVTNSPFQRENVTFVPLAGSRLQRVVKLYKELKRLHLERPLDVITTQTIHWEAWVALFFGQLHRVNVVGQIHYDLFLADARRRGSRFTPYSWLYHQLGMMALRRMTAVRVVGRRIGDQLVAAGLRTPIHILPVPVTMNIPANEQPPSPISRVIFVGRLSPEKNIEEWLQIAQQVVAQNPETMFTIAGDGPLRRQLESRATQLGLEQQVHFAGNVPYEQLPSFYGSAKVFLLTSKYEGFGRVLVEAYLCGVPAVAPEITGVEDIIVAGQTGFLHLPGDISGMAGSVLHLLQEESVRRQMAEQGREWVKTHFDPGKLTHKWIKLLISVTSEDKP